MQVKSSLPMEAFLSYPLLASTYETSSSADCSTASVLVVVLKKGKKRREIAKGALAACLYKLKDTHNIRGARSTLQVFAGTKYSS
jgi:hypothetical protein